jgi:hypothetical protein
MWVGQMFYFMASTEGRGNSTITWVDDAFNAGMVFQIASNGEAVFHVFPHSKVQSLQTAVDQETIKRRRNRSNS